MERLDNKQYLVENDGSGRVLLRTRGHLRKIKPSIRSSGWPQMDPVLLHQEEPVEVPLHIPGGMAACSTQNMITRRCKRREGRG